MDTQPTPSGNVENKDWLDRKLDRGMELIKMAFGMVQKNSRDFILTLSIIANVYLGHKIIDNQEVMNNKIVEEVRKQVPSEVEKKTKQKLDGIVDTIKSTTQDVRDLVEYQRKQNKK